MAPLNVLLTLFPPKWCQNGPSVLELYAMPSKVRKCHIDCVTVVKQALLATLQTPYHLVGKSRNNGITEQSLNILMDMCVIIHFRMVNSRHCMSTQIFSHVIALKAQNCGHGLFGPFVPHLPCLFPDVLSNGIPL